MDKFSQLVIDAVRVDSIWSIVIRALLWLVFVSIFALGVSKGQKYGRIKSEAGFFVFFIILTGITIYAVYGIVPTLTATPDQPAQQTPFGSTLDQ